MKIWAGLIFVLGIAGLVPVLRHRSGEGFRAVEVVRMIAGIGCLIAAAVMFFMSDGAQ
jgi:hypothetical protein